VNCKKIQQLISPYLDGELTPGEMEAVEYHLNNCPECQQEFNKLKNISLALGQVGRDIFPAPVGFTDSVMQCIREDAAVSGTIGPLFRVKGIRQWAAGIAAATVIVLSAVGINWGPVLQLADNSPGDKPAVIGTLLQPGESNNSVVENNITIPNEEPTPSNNNIENPVISNNQGNNIVNPRENPVIEDRNYEANVVLLSTAPVIKTTMLQIRVNDSAEALAKVLEIASNNIKMVQKINEDGYTVVKIDVPISDAGNFIEKFSAMGMIISSQEDEKDVAAGYAESLEQYRNLINQYNDSGDADERARLNERIKSLETQLSDWQKEAEQQTIVLVIQQK